MIEGVDLAALGQWIVAEGLAADPIADARILSGGTQNILVRFRCGAQHFVLRRPPLVLRPNSNATMVREAQVLRALKGSAVPHPRLIAVCETGDVIGASFYLMEPVEGFNPVAGLPALHASRPDLRHRIGLGMVESIASLAAIAWRDVGLADFGRPDDFLARQVGRWHTQLEGYGQMKGWPGPQELPEMGRISAWLEAHRPAAFEAGIMHGDFHLANVMVAPDSGEVAAIVDWELATIGDPLLDLGWLLATWPEGAVPAPGDVAAEPWAGFASGDELVRHYERVSGRTLPHIDWYVVLACFKLGIVLEGTFARACAGHAPMPVGERLHAQAIHLFNKALRRIA